MAFKKGMSGNPDGRPRGAKNRTTEELRQMLQSFLEGKLDEIDEIWRGLDPWQKVQFIDRLLKHTLPTPLHELEKLSDEQIDILIQKLKQDRLKFN